MESHICKPQLKHLLRPNEPLWTWLTMRVMLSAHNSGSKFPPSPKKNFQLYDILIILSARMKHVCLPMALQPPVGPWPLWSLYTVGRTPWTEDQPVAMPLSGHRTTHIQNTQRHSWLKWDSNPGSQCMRGRRQFMPYTTRPLWAANEACNTSVFPVYFC
jgi:hypothetical protein